MSDLLGDSHIAKAGIARLQLNNRRDEFRGRALGAGLAVTGAGGRESAGLPLDQRAVELEQRCRLDERAKLQDSVRAHEKRGQTEDEAIQCSQIRCALPRSITDQKLMFEQEGLGGDGARATGAEQLRAGDQQVNGANQEVAHGVNRNMTTGARKTARYGRIPSYNEFAPRRRAQCNRSGLP